MHEADPFKRLFGLKRGRSEQGAAEGEVLTRGERGLEAVAVADGMEALDERNVFGPVLLRNDLAGRRGDRARERREECRLPGAVPPRHHEGLPGFDSKREALENEAPAASM